MRRKIEKRRLNIEFLAQQYGSQSGLARALSKSNIKTTQPSISDIIRGKRDLHYIEARCIEKALQLPNLSLDYIDLATTKEKIIEFKKLNKENIKLFNELIYKYFEEKPTDLILQKILSTIAKK